MKKLLIILTAFISTLATAQTQRQKDSTMLVNGGHCILLDFDGQSISTPLWGNVTASASPISGNTSAMDSVVNYVAELYSPFGVVVTRDSSLYFIAPTDKRHRVILSPTYAHYGNILGATRMSDSISFVNSNQATTVQIRGRAIAHEVLHQFGLVHLTTGGSGTGETSWWPLMRASIQIGYNMQTWSKGTDEYDAFQDDIKTLSLQAGLRLDDAGNSMTTGKYLRKNQLFTGLIGLNDNDFFKIEIPSTQMVSISAVPWSNGSNNANATVDLAMDVYDFRGNLIVSSDNTATLNASISQSLTAGTYYIRVHADTGNANNPTGYGFMGHYTILFTY